jgi:signal transduction protein with GAF and PtsI domain
MFVREVFVDHTDGDISVGLIVDLSSEDKTFETGRLERAFKQMQSDVKDVIERDLVSRSKDLKAQIPQEKEF